MTFERIKNIRETIEIVENKITSIKRLIKFDKISKEKREKYKIQLNNASDNLAKLRALKKDLESRK